MQDLDIYLPSALLALAFMIKLFVDRSTTAPIVVRSLLELPVDIAFLGMSFIAAFTISARGDHGQGLLAFIFFIIASLLIVFLWRRSLILFEADKLLFASLAGILNYAISIFCVIYSIDLLKKVVEG